LGYATGQFGKNHLGDLNKHLPTAHGFDEFFGNLYHLNAEEEPELRDYPRDMKLANGKTFLETFGPRGVIKTKSDGKGGQSIENLGPLTKKRMETIDEEVNVKAIDFMERAARANKPFFMWWNSTRMHIFTHLKKESAGKTGLGIYADGMVEHDGMVGQLLAKLDELGIADNTIVIFTSDNGGERFSDTWPFTGIKTELLEGGLRVPLLVRWPGKVAPGVNDTPVLLTDLMPTLLAAVCTGRERPRFRVLRVKIYDLNTGLRLPRLTCV
jgi:arylsulfatase